MGTDISASAALVPGESEQLYWALFEATPDAIIVTDPAGTICHANRQAEALFGYVHEQLIGENIDCLLPSQLRAAHASHRLRYQADPRTRPMGMGLRLVGRRQDGQEFPIEVSLSPVRIRDGAYTMCILRDVTELRRREHEFFAIATHELRTPVTLIHGYMQLFRRRLQQDKIKLTTAQNTLMTTIDSAIGRLVELTDDLLDVSRIENGKLDLRPGPVILEGLVRHVLQRFQGITEHHQFILSFEPEGLIVLCDPSRTEQVLNNLLSNAVKYSPHGTTIHLAMHRDDEQQMAVLAVKDQGIGILPEHQQHLFERFMRGENARSLGIAGTGLGLYLCRELMERQGGRIWFESGSDQGTTFFVAFPLFVADDHDETIPALGQHNAEILG